MQTSITLSGFVQNSAVGIVGGRTAFAISVKCENQGMSSLIESRLKNFLENDNLLCTAVSDIHNNKTIEGMTIIDFIMSENLAATPMTAKRLIMGGSVKKKDQRGEWKVVASPEAVVRPGWWRVRRGMMKIGEDYIVEKRLTGQGVFSKPLVSR